MNRKRQIMNHLTIKDCDDQLKALKAASVSLRNASSVSYMLGADLDFLEQLDVAHGALFDQIGHVEEIRAQVHRSLVPC